MANTTLLKPTTIEAVVDENNPNLAVVTLEPFERGYGHTLAMLYVVFCLLAWLVMHLQKPKSAALFTNTLKSTAF